MFCSFSKKIRIAVALALLFSVPAFAVKNGAAKAPAKEQGADKVPLISTQKYNPKKEVGRGLNEFTSSLGLLTFGNIYRATALDVEKMLLEKLSAPELKIYFPSENERKKLAAKIANTIDAKYFRGGLTNDNVIGATRYAAGELIEMVVQRAMAKEGVKSAERRGIWAQKILSPFRVCMDHARTYIEGNKCLDSAQEDAVKNIGIGIAYEMIRQEMAPAYTNGLSQPYQKCLNLKKPGANDRVKGCVISLMRNAAADFGIDKVREAAAEQAPASAEAIAKSVRPAFVKCLGKVSERNGFAVCADSLIGQAGGEIAAAAVMDSGQVKTYFPDLKKRQKLADSGKNQFLACMETNRTADKRDGSGNLSTENCVNLVRLETARGVTHALIEGNLEKLSDLKPEQRKRIRDAVVKGLDDCWDSRAGDEKNNACMKDSIESLVGAVAEIKLTNRIPPVMAAKDPKLKEKLTASVRTCIRHDLPDNIMHSSDAALKVDGCAAQLLKEAALKVAAFELRQVIHGKTSKEAAADELVKKLVDTDLAACLGKLPTDAVLSKCTSQLKKSAASSVGELLFQEEFGRFVDKKGGLAALGIEPAERQRFLDDLLTSHRLCVSQIKGASVDQAVDACFKTSIQSLAGYLGKLAFRKGSRDYVNGAELDQLTARFQADLTHCLREKDDPKYSLNDYIANIDSCGNRLSSSYTLDLGSRQIADALATNLPDSSLAGKRESLQKELVSEFSLCLDKGEREACATEMKKRATKEITVEAAREQAKELLNGGSLPKEFAAAEEKLQACLDGGTSPDLCARRHAQNAAKILGSLKLKVSLGSALGEAKYKQSGRSIASLENFFFACVDNIPGDKPDAAFMQALKNCGEKMETKGVTLVQENLNDWMSLPGASPLEMSLRNEAANAIPCLGPILPSGPVTEAALTKLDPEGLLQSVAKVVGDYINYDAKKADKHFEKVLQQVISDLEAAGPVEARQNLFDLLVKGGMVDQLLKSMVRAQVKSSLDALPESEKLAPELEAILLDKATLEAALTPELMVKLRPFMADKLLKPLLIQGQTLSDPGPSAALKLIEKQVAEALLASPAFGDRLVAGSVQQQIDNQTAGTMSRWFARNLMGYSYDWTAIRATEGGVTAENYVRDQIIRPMVMGENLPAEELAARRAEASRLVTAAVKNQ